jgi:hypothetical protein
MEGQGGISLADWSTVVFALACGFLFEKHDAT